MTEPRPDPMTEAFPEPEVEPGDATPTAVTISEWVELARSYSGESARKLVNGVLGRVAREASRRPRSGTTEGQQTTSDQEEPPT